MNSVFFLFMGTVWSRTISIRSARKSAFGWFLFEWLYRSNWKHKLWRIDSTDLSSKAQGLTWFFHISVEFERPRNGRGNSGRISHRGWAGRACGTESKRGYRNFVGSTWPCPVMVCDGPEPEWDKQTIFIIYFARGGKQMSCLVGSSMPSIGIFPRHMAETWLHLSVDRDPSHLQ